MWIRLDTRRSPNGEREGTPLPLNGPSAPILVIEDRLAISAASAATVFALAIRRAALSRLVEMPEPSVLMQIREYTPVGPSSNIDPHARGSQKAPHNRGL
jgi:hypothetical protein